MSNPLHIIILAAGEGTRMKSNRPKMLQTVGGRPMLTHLLDTAASLTREKIHVVVGSGSERVMEACAGYPVDWVHQAERRGTGHAVMQAMPGVPDDADVLVLLGDTPLIPGELLADMVDQFHGPLSLLTMELEDPTGYGRILRDPGGNIIGVIEHKDAEPHQHAIREVNTGIIMAQAGKLRGWLDRIGCDNAKQEYYLPDIFSLARAENGEIPGVVAPDAADLQGANDRRQLAELERRYQGRQAEKLMASGVQLIDPQRIDVRAEVDAGMNVLIDVNVVLEGRVRPVSYTHLTLPTIILPCRSRWAPDH